MKIVRMVTAALAGVAVTACGGSNDTSGPATGIIMGSASPSGDGQTGAPGTQLEQPFRVLLLNTASQPAVGVAVAWKVTAGGGSLSASTSTSDAKGVATTLLTLGPNAGINTVTASVPGVNGSPQTFLATGVVPGEFVQVDVVNNQFSPESVTIVPGGTVLFRWPEGSRQHNVVPVAPQTKPSSAAVRDGPFTYEERFPAPGTYNYFCSVHGSPTSGMRGRIVVQ